MTGWGADGKFGDRSFKDGDSIVFRIEVDDQARAWWKEAFLDRYGMTPESLGIALTRSWEQGREIIVTELDGQAKRIQLQVRGGFGTGEFWVTQRTTDMLGNLANADRLFIPRDKQSHGLGRRLMRDRLARSSASGRR